MRLAPTGRLLALRRMAWPILETAGAAVVAWYLAKLALGDRETGFAPIAALICLGATLGQQRERALELCAGVALGVLIADLLVRVLGTGPWQVGLMVILAMSAAVLVGGGTLLTVEAGVSAIIIGSVEPSTVGLFPIRPIEGLIGAAVAFAVHLVVFPPDPLLLVGRAANTVVATLGNALEDTGEALRDGDRTMAEQALQAARGIDRDVAALGDAVEIGRDTARQAPLRRSARDELDRLEDVGRHLDFSGRNARVLARDSARMMRREAVPVPDVAEAVLDLARSVWAVGAALDDPGAGAQARALALRAGGRATEATARHADLDVLQIAGHVRATAVDLVRAADAAQAQSPGGIGAASTEEMLAASAEPVGPADGELPR